MKNRARRSRFEAFTPKTVEGSVVRTSASAQQKTSATQQKASTNVLPLFQKEAPVVPVVPSKFILPPTSSAFGPTTPPPNGTIVDVVIKENMASETFVPLQLPTKPLQVLKTPLGPQASSKPPEGPIYEGRGFVPPAPQPQPQQTQPQEQQDSQAKYFVEVSPPQPVVKETVPTSNSKNNIQAEVKPNLVFNLPGKNGQKDKGGAGISQTTSPTLPKTPEQMQGLIFPVIGAAGAGYFAWKYGKLSPIVSTILAVVAYVGVDLALKMNVGKINPLAR